MKPAHDKKGNCLDKTLVNACGDCGAGACCDVCHEHEEPRGECARCPHCPRCSPALKKLGVTAAKRIYG